MRRDEQAEVLSLRQHLLRSLLKQVSSEDLEDAIQDCLLRLASQIDLADYKDRMLMVDSIVAFVVQDFARARAVDDNTHLIDESMIEEVSPFDLDKVLQDHYNREIINTAFFSLKPIMRALIWTCDHHSLFDSNVFYPADCDFIMWHLHKEDAKREIDPRKRELWSNSETSKEAPKYSRALNLLSRAIIKLMERDLD